MQGVYQGILEGAGGQGPQKGRVVGILKLTSQKSRGLNPLTPPPPIRHCHGSRSLSTDSGSLHDKPSSQ